MRCCSLMGGVLVVLFLLVATARPDGSAKKPDDAETVRSIVGKWYGEIKEKGAELKGTDTFREDGTFSGEGTFKRQNQTLKVSMSGTWKVVGGVLIETIETYDPPVLKKGHVSKDQVLMVTDKVLRLKSESGKEIIKKRVSK